jgi:hypothetical protein
LVSAGCPEAHSPWIPRGNCLKSQQAKQDKVKDNSTPCKQLEETEVTEKKAIVIKVNFSSFQGIKVDSIYWVHVPDAVLSI